MYINISMNILYMYTYVCIYIYICIDHHRSMLYVNIFRCDPGPSDRASTEAVRQIAQNGRVQGLRQGKRRLGSLEAEDFWDF